MYKVITYLAHIVILSEIEKNVDEHMKCTYDDAYRRNCGFIQH